MPIITRRICTSSIELIFARFLTFPSEGDFLPSFFCQSVSALLEQERTIVLLDQARTLVQTTRVPFRTLSGCFPPKAFFHFPFDADPSSSMTLDQYSRLISCIPHPVVARPGHLINVSHRNVLPSSDFSDFPPYKFENKFLCAIKRIPSRKLPGKSRSRYCTILLFFSHSFSFVQHFCLYQLASIRKKTMPNSLNSRKLLRQVDLQKRVLMTPMSSVCQAASKIRC